MAALQCEYRQTTAHTLHTPKRELHVAYVTTTTIARQLRLSKDDFLGTLSYPEGNMILRSHFNTRAPKQSSKQSDDLVSSLHCAKILYQVIWSDPATNPERQVRSPPLFTVEMVGSESYPLGELAFEPRSDRKFPGLD